MIDLNTKKFDYQYLTKDDILSEITEEELFRRYIGNFQFNKAISNPLRRDIHPSFSVFYSSKFGKLMFKDHATGDSGDVFTFISRIYNSLSFPELLNQICADSNIDIDLISSLKSSTIKHKEVDYTKYKNHSTSIRIKSKVFSGDDLRFWDQFGISESTLNLFNVKSVKYIFLNDNIISPKGLCFAYIEFKDMLKSYKIYQPYSDIYKWLTNHSASVHQGYNQLPKSGELLIITKSLKDVMSLYEVCNIPSIGIQTETVYIKESVMEEYYSRFDNVICLFDNDEAGRKLSEGYSDRYNLDTIFIPDKYSCKDFSDLVKTVGISNARNVLNKLL